MEKIFMVDACLACTICNAHCPVMNATGEYIGPKLIGPNHLKMHFAEESEEDTLSYCTNCKTCDRSCPSNVHVSTLNMLTRGQSYENKPHSLRDFMLSNHDVASNIFRSLPFGAHIANLSLKIAKYLGVFKMLGIVTNRNLPKYSGDSFSDMLLDKQQRPSHKKVVLFQGCFIQHNAPQVGMDFVKVMQKNGYEVLRDNEFCCCGSPLVSGGYLEKARENAIVNAERILKWEQKKIPVIALCTSCSLMLKEEAYELFDDERLIMAGRNVYDAFEFLRMLNEKGEFVKPTKVTQQNLLYHLPCHLKSQGIGAPAKDILDFIEGTNTKVLETGCCGMAGSYGFQKETAEISLKIGEDLFNRINELEGEVICDCATCRLQIEYATKRPAAHPIQILSKAYNNGE